MIQNLWLFDKGVNGHFSNTQSALLQSNGYALHGKKWGFAGDIATVLWIRFLVIG